MYKIRELIKERCKLGSRGYRPFEEEIKILAKTTSFIIEEKELLEGKLRDSLPNHLFITGIYDLGEPFLNSDKRFYLAIISKEQRNIIDFSIFNGNCKQFISFSGVEEFLYNPDAYTQEWDKYIDILETWISSGERPDNTETFEFVSVSKEQLYKDSILPSIYSSESITLRKEISEKNAKIITEYAEIIIPRIEKANEKYGKVIRIRDLEYPLNVAGIELDVVTNVCLQKGDIVISRTKPNAKVFLFDYKGDELIYAASTLIVIRCKELQPEYLYLYLTSKTAVKVLKATNEKTVDNGISGKTIRELTILPPAKSPEKYRLDFETLAYTNSRHYYATSQRIKAYYNAFTKNSSRSESNNRVDEISAEEDILSEELASRIKAFREDQLRAFLKDDLKELNTCFRHKAYKATLILAGSILEAVLIDWLSDIHGKNYFEEDYYITSHSGKTKRAELIHYINSIKFIYRPKWMEEADKAHEIRKKRNLVHAKLCMKSDMDINEETCKQVIGYLKDILKTRGASK